MFQLLVVDRTVVYVSFEWFAETRKQTEIEVATRQDGMILEVCLMSVQTVSLLFAFVLEFAKSQSRLCCFSNAAQLQIVNKTVKTVHTLW